MSKITYRISLLTVALLVAPMATPTARAANLAQHHFLANGLDVSIYTADALASALTSGSNGDVILLDDRRYLSVITDINDPAIYNKGDGEFHAFSVEQVLSALSSIKHPNIRFDVKVYLLPYPRRNILVSSTSGNEIFLSPHVLDIDSSVAAYIVAHELGHVFHNAYLPSYSSRWDDYRAIRGITDTERFSSTASHPYRPQEILAEDFRVLFGGELAAFGGRVENHEIVPPDAVPGLRVFFENLGGEIATRTPKVVATSTPNPFNPTTDIRITVPEEVRSQGGVEVNVYDVRGRLVRQLYTGVSPGSEILLRWDATDRAGNPVASGNYYARVRAGDSQTTLKLVLLK